MWFIYNSMLQLIWTGWRAPGLGPMPPERGRKSQPSLCRGMSNGSGSLWINSLRIIAHTPPPPLFLLGCLSSSENLSSSSWWDLGDAANQGCRSSCVVIHRERRSTQTSYWTKSDMQEKLIDMSKNYSMVKWRMLLIKIKYSVSVQVWTNFKHFREISSTHACSITYCVYLCVY